MEENEKAIARRAQGRGWGTTPPRRVVAFTGLAGSGKTTAALRLVSQHGYARVRFAGPLKSMLSALGLSPSELDGELKEKPCAILGGKTPRWAQQSLGTEWGRNLIDENIWIYAWRAAIDNLPPGQPVVADDCRFQNEVDAVREMGGIVCLIRRQGVEPVASGIIHASEAFAYEMPPDLVLANDGSMEQFLGGVSYVFGSVDE